MKRLYLWQSDRDGSLLTVNGLVAVYHTRTQAQRALTRRAKVTVPFDVGDWVLCRAGIAQDGKE